MNSLSKVICGLVLAASAPLFAVSNSAVSGGPLLAPTVGGGWDYDQIDAANTDSVGSPFVYNLSGSALFSVADSFNTGDTYKVYDFGNLILTTSVTGGGQPFGPLPFGFPTGPAYSWGSVSLGAGAHSLTIQGDGAGGLSAGFYTRLDAAPAVPDAGSTALLGGAALLGLVGLRRKLA